MAESIFAITVKEKTTRLDRATRTGRLVFTVGNTVARPVKTRVEARPEGATSPAWLSVAPQTQVLAPRATQVFTVEIGVPAGAPAGTFGLHLFACDDEAPDDYATTGPSASFDVPPPPDDGKRRRWLWVLVAVAALVVLGVGGWLLVCQVFGKCGEKRLPLHASCRTGPEAPACAEGLACAPLGGESFSCRRKPGAECSAQMETECTSLWCRDGKCSRDDGGCETDVDCRFTDVYVCTATKVCRKRDGQACTDGGVCASGSCGQDSRCTSSVAEPCDLACPRLSHCVLRPFKHCVRDVFFPFDPRIRELPHRIGGGG